MCWSSFVLRFFFLVLTCVKGKFVGRREKNKLGCEILEHSGTVLPTLQGQTWRSYGPYLGWRRRDITRTVNLSLLCSGPYGTWWGGGIRVVLCSRCCDDEEGDIVSNGRSGLQRLA